MEIGIVLTFDKFHSKIIPGLYKSCRYPSTDFYGGELKPQSQLPIFEEAPCVQKCLGLEECIAVTLVKPNPEFYNSAIHGCHLKSGGWQVRTTPQEANMVSVDVVCVRGNFFDNHDINFVIEHFHITIIFFNSLLFFCP